MRLLGALLWLPVLSAAAKPHPAPPDTSHLVDILSASPDHQLLLAAFQRARLIPTLNRLNGSTLFAPTDEAIRRERDREKERALSGSAGASVWTPVVDWVDEGQANSDEHDNLQLALRDTLLYHVLNFTLLAAPASNDTNSTRPEPPKPLPFDVPVLEETLYFPSLFPYNRSFPAPPTLPGTEPDRPDPDAPKGRPEGLLHDEGQRLRVLQKRGEKGDELWVGVDWKGEGGIKTTGDNQFARNGVFVPIEEVLHKPEDLGELSRLSLKTRGPLTSRANSHSNPHDSRALDVRLASPTRRSRLHQHGSSLDPLLPNERRLVRLDRSGDALYSIRLRRRRPERDLWRRGVADGCRKGQGWIP